MDDAASTSAHDAYVERVKAEFDGPRYDWFSELLTRSAYRELPIEDSRLYIVDFDGNAGSKEVLRAAVNDNVHGGVLDALNSSLSSATATRVVSLYHPWEEFHLGLKFLNIKHFEFLNPGLARPPPSLDTSILQFRFKNATLITVCVVRDVVVILYRYDLRRPFELIEPLLMKSFWLQGDRAVSGLRLPPVDLVALFLQVETLKLVRWVHVVDEYIIREGSLQQLASEEQTGAGSWEACWRVRVEIETTVRNLTAALASEQWSKGGAPLAKRLLQEYNILLDQSRSQGEYVKEHLQHINTVTSIEETRRGIQQSDSVRRLTVVAFVFIPLNFATSFFGMNVQQLGTGSINIGYFFLAAALIGGFAATLSFSVKPLERRMQHRLREIADDLVEGVMDIQRREILRQSKLGERLWTRMVNIGDVGLDRDVWRASRPKFRRAMKHSAYQCLKMLTNSWRYFTTRQQAHADAEIEDGSRADRH